MTRKHEHWEELQSTCMLSIYCHTYHFTPFEFCELYLVLCVKVNVPRSLQYHQKKD